MEWPNVHRWLVILRQKILYQNHPENTGRNNGSQNRPRPTGVGEIFVRGENVMSGYYKILATEQILDTGGIGCTPAIWVRWMPKVMRFIRGRNKTMILSANDKILSPRSSKQNWTICHCNENYNRQQWKNWLLWYVRITMLMLKVSTRKGWKMSWKKIEKC